MRGLDRSTALWLRAFPRRWRAQHANEVAEVLIDLAPIGATRLDVRAAAGLVRAGWETRWRQRPPVGAFLRYRVLGRRPAPRYDGWLRDDLEGGLYPWRAALVLSVVLGVPFLTLGSVIDWSLVVCAGGLVGGYVITVVDHARRRTDAIAALFGSPREIGRMGPYRVLDR